MKLPFGFEITRRPRMQVDGTVVNSGRGWFSVIGEWFPGAWQASVPMDQQTLLSFSAVFSCVTIIASDIAKLRARIVEEDADGVCTEAAATEKRAADAIELLRKPNPIQNRIKFIEQWIVSKLLSGNTYVLKVRDAKRRVIALYVLDPTRVQTLVTPSGDVYYKVNKDPLSKVPDEITIPASEIIHDMMVSLFHPLVGVSPIFACANAAALGKKIEHNSSKFFDNMSRPSGMLSAPGSISEEVAARLKEEWEKNFSGANIGRLAVLGDGLKYEAMTIPAREAQLIEQLKWSKEEVATVFHVPLYKIGGAVPAGNSIEQLNQNYYSECLQILIESLEINIDEGLNVPPPLYTEVDLSGLLRMDSKAQIEYLSEGVGGGIMAPNEARFRINLKRTAGGEAPYLQQQNYSLAALAKRDAGPDPFGKPTAPPPALPAPRNEADATLMRAVIAGLLEAKP